MSVIRRIRLTQDEGHQRWTWRDAVTGEPGRARLELEGLGEGDELVVELAWEREWIGRRFIQVPERILARQIGELRLGAQSPDPEPAWEPEGWTEPVVGEVRIAQVAMDGRSTADRDAGRSAKGRPAIVVWVDEGNREAGVRLIYGTNSAVRRRGEGRRLRNWQGAGLRKPSVVSADESIRSFSELGARKGEVAPEDRAWLLE